MTSIHTDLKQLNEDSLRAVSQYVRVLIMHSGNNATSAESDTQTRGFTYQNMLKRLSDFQEFEQGWDGEDARPLSHAAVKNFKEVLNACSDTQLTGWTIYPAANGSLLLEYQQRQAGINISGKEFSYYDINDGTAKGANHCIFKPSSVIDTMRKISRNG